MTLDFFALTKKQREAVRWLHRQRGRVIVPPIEKGDAYEMHGRTRSKSREPLVRFVWRGTFNALFYKGWLSMDDGGWVLSPDALTALERAHFETDGFTEEVV